MSVTRQFIDRSGKCRVIQSGDVFVITQPTHPYKVPTFDVSEIKGVTLERAIDYIKDNQLKISLQSGTKEDGTRGLWFDDSFIVIEPKPKKFVESVEFTDKPDPIKLDETSLLKQNMMNRIVSHYLKEYCLYQYSKNDKVEFVIDPNHFYQISELKGAFVDDTDIIFRDGKIIVPNELVAKRLKAYVMNQLFMNKNEIKNKRYQKLVKGLYTELSNFSPRSGEIVLDDLESIRLQNKQLADRKELFRIYPKAEEPYLFLNEYISKKMVLIQNVLGGDLERALSVARTWGEKDENRFNQGYRSDIDVEMDDLLDQYNIAIHKLELDFRPEYMKGNDLDKPTLRIMERNEKYSAILELN